MHIELIKIAKEYYHTDMILFHDDMGTQISTFFSPQIYKELFCLSTKRSQRQLMTWECISVFIPADVSVL